MSPLQLTRAVLPSLGLLLAVGGCGGDDKKDPDASGGSGGSSTSSSNVGGSGGSTGGGGTGGGGTGGGGTGGGGTGGGGTGGSGAAAGEAGNAGQAGEGGTPAMGCGYDAIGEQFICGGTDPAPPTLCVDDLCCTQTCMPGGPGSSCCDYATGELTLYGYASGMCPQYDSNMCESG